MIPNLTVRQMKQVLPVFNSEWRSASKFFSSSSAFVSCVLMCLSSSRLRLRDERLSAHACLSSLVFLGVAGLRMGGKDGLIFVLFNRPDSESFLCIRCLEVFLLGCELVDCWTGDLLNWTLFARFCFPFNVLGHVFFTSSVDMFKLLSLSIGSSSILSTCLTPFFLLLCFSLSLVEDFLSNLRNACNPEPPLISWKLTR